MTAATDTDYALLSIDPKWATAIYDDDKQYEYRRAPPTCDTPFVAVLYETTPTKAVTGHARVDAVVRDADTETVIDSTVEETPHTREDLLDYFDGSDTAAALRVASTTQYDTPIPVDRLRDEFALSVPQNFHYLSNHEYIALLSVATP